MILFAAMKVSFDPREVWTRIRWANGEAPATVASAESTLSMETGP
jgi:hypothetical protein